MSLHVSVEIILCRLNQVIVVSVVVPHAFVSRHGGFGATDDNATIYPGNQVVVHARTGPETVRVVQVWRLFRIRSHDTAAYSSTGHNLLRVLGQNAGGETIRGKDYLLGCNGPSRRGDDVAPVVVRSRRHMRDGRMRLQVEPIGNGEAEEMSDELVRPEMGCGEAEAAFRAFDTGYSFRVSGRGEMCVLNGRQAFFHHDIVRFFGFAGELFVQEDVEGAGQGEVAVDTFFLDEFLDCLDVGDFVVGDLGGGFDAVFLDVVAHGEVDFGS